MKNNQNCVKKMKIKKKFLKKIKEKFSNKNRLTFQFSG